MGKDLEKRQPSEVEGVLKSHRRRFTSLILDIKSKWGGEDGEDGRLWILGDDVFLVAKRDGDEFADLLIRTKYPSSDSRYVYEESVFASFSDEEGISSARVTKERFKNGEDTHDLLMEVNYGPMGAEGTVALIDPEIRSEYNKLYREGIGRTIYSTSEKRVTNWISGRNLIVDESADLLVIQDYERAKEVVFPKEFNVYTKLREASEQLLSKHMTGERGLSYKISDYISDEARTGLEQMAKELGPAHNRVVAAEALDIIRSLGEHLYIYTKKKGVGRNNVALEVKNENNKISEIIIKKEQDGVESKTIFDLRGDDPVITVKRRRGPVTVSMQYDGVNGEGDTLLNDRVKIEICDSGYTQSEHGEIEYNFSDGTSEWSRLYLAVEKDRTGKNLRVSYDSHSEDLILPRGVNIYSELEKAKEEMLR